MGPSSSEWRLSTGLGGQEADLSPCGTLLGLSASKKPRSPSPVSQLFGKRSRLGHGLCLLFVVLFFFFKQNISSCLIFFNGFSRGAQTKQDFSVLHCEFYSLGEFCLFSFLGCFGLLEDYRKRGTWKRTSLPSASFPLPPLPQTLPVLKNRPSRLVGGETVCDICPSAGTQHIEPSASPPT